MKEEFEIDDIWVPYEIHPETPVEGRLITELFTQWDVDYVISTCRQRTERYGFTFADRPWLSNSRKALEAAEFARAKGKYHPMHNALFKAYFSDGQDIGDMKILLKLASENGLDSNELETALNEKTYAKTVAQGSEEARLLGVRAVPSFFIEDLPVITGAVHEDVFRKALQNIVS